MARLLLVVSDDENAEEAAIVRYAQRSTRMDVTDDHTSGDLPAHVTPEQIVPGA